MTASRTPTVHWDAEDGLCGAWELDWYEVGSQPVHGPSVTKTSRAPGWTGANDEDYCPEHSHLSLRPATCGVCGSTESCDHLPAWEREHLSTRPGGSAS